MNTVVRGVKSAWCALSPSLALIKYWGKRGRRHIPATTSIAVSLNNLHTRTAVRWAPRAAEGDTVVCNRHALSPAEVAEHYTPFLTTLRRRCGVQSYLDIDIELDFPIAAGLASSSAIFASLTLALAALCGYRAPPQRLSSLARLGSVSAARATLGGFVILPAKAKAARTLYPATYWDDLRIVIAITDSHRKQTATRSAMRVVQRSSFAYRGWLWSSHKIAATARRALQERNLEKLGTAMRSSYLGMHATTISAQPPIIFWNQKSVALIRLCEELRLKGVEAWETMDAGPQVKILTRTTEVERLEREIQSAIPGVQLIVSEIGGAPQIASEP